LVSIVTEPPVLVETPPVAESVHPGWVIPSTYLQFDGFLTPDEQAQLLAYSLEREDVFKPSTVSTNEPDYRESMVEHDIVDSRWGTLFRDRLMVYLPQILRRLGKAPFPIDRIEVQLTANNDGAYFKVHNDAGGDADICREITYVYYFNREPKRFSGGELVLYDSKVENNFYVQTESQRIVEPRNNCLIVFLSFAHHEVMPVRCPSGEFADSRFTVNGWFRRDLEKGAA
jgi:Rps23 Pro-64 3,4-dihydroxylase Tpa1-like proline 4-hydroxylase